VTVGIVHSEAGVAGRHKEARSAEGVPRRTKFADKRQRAAQRSSCPRYHLYILLSSLTLAFQSLVSEQLYPFAGSSGFATNRSFLRPARFSNSN